MFNKKRMVVFTVFLMFMFLFITFAGGTPQNQAIATRMVTFIDGYNSEVISEQRVLVGEDAEVPEDPRHDNSVFVGWYLDEDRETRVTDFSNVISNITVVALYGADLNGNGIVDDNDTYYTVRFVDSFDNSVISTQEVLVGMNATAPTAPVHAGMTFVGWSRGFFNIQEDVTVNSVMRANNQLAEVNRYNVTFIDGDTNEVISVVSIEEGLTATTPEAPKHEKRVFVRWDGDYTNINSERTITAIYADDINNNGEADDVEKRLTVTYYSELNGEVLVDGSYLAKSNYTLVKNPFKKEKQVFIGWSRVPVEKVISRKDELDDLSLVQPGTVETLENDDVHYYAVWAENKNEDYEKENGIDPTPDYMENRYSLLVNYKDVNGKQYVNEESYVVNNLLAGEEVSFNTKVNINYIIVVDTGLLENVKQSTSKVVGTMPASDVEVTTTYKAILDNNNNGIDDNEEDHYTLTINYVNTKGTKVFDTVTKSLVEGESYKVESPEKEYYTVDKEVVEGVMGSADLEVEVTYKAGTDNNNNGIDDNEEDHYTLTINYVNTKGTKVFDTVTKSLVEGESYKVESPEKEYYTVDKEVVEGVMGNADLEVEVTYKADIDNNDNGVADQDEKLTVRFIDWDNSVISTQYVMYGESAEAPSNPIRSNTAEWKYTFTGWLQDFDNIQSDLDVYADYSQTKQQYTVTFLDYYGNKISDVTVDYGTTTVVAPKVDAEISVGNDNIVSFKEWSTDEYKNVVKDTTVRAKYIMVKASTASLFELKENYIRQIKGGADDSSRFTDNNVSIAIKDDETGKLADIMSNWNTNSGELKLAVGKDEIRKYLSSDGLELVDSQSYDIYVLKYNGTKWHLDYQKNPEDIAVYRYNQQGKVDVVSKQLKLITTTHTITSIDRYDDSKLVESVGVHNQGNGVYISDSFQVADINQTGSYTTGKWSWNKVYHDCYYIVNYDDGSTLKIYWSK